MANVKMAVWGVALLLVGCADDAGEDEGGQATGGTSSTGDVATGDTAASRGCSLLSVARLADSANPSVGILLRAQRLLSNRLIHLEVTGTARRPMVRALPLPLLSDEALRYFLEQAAA